MNRKNSILGIGFVILFIVAIIGIFMTYKTDVPVSLCFFGSVFVFLGIAFIVSDKKLTVKKLPLLAFPLAGMVIISLSLIYKFGDDAVKEGILSFWIPFLGLSLFVAIGLGQIISATLKTIIKRNKCSVIITAECTGLDKKYSRDNDGYSSITYAPVFTYYFEGSEYKGKHDYYSNIDVPKIGNEYEIRINPNKPTEIYRPSWKNKFFVYLFGVCFAGMGLYAMYMTFWS